MVNSVPAVLQTLPGAGTQAGEERDDNSLKMKLVWCPPGSFTMGSSPSESGRGSAEDLVRVTLTRGFWLGKYEVTQREWRDVMGTEPWKGQEYLKEGDRFPATFVSWDNAIAFCEKLTAAERKSGRLPDGWEYTLPTEAQWEYACRAGTPTAYSFGDSESALSDYAWWGGVVGNGNAKTEKYAHAVGLKRPNGWNLCDMHGNVLEWCRDGYDGAQLPGGTDPLGPTWGRMGPSPGPSSGSYRVYRGGGWNFDAGYCRSAYRGGNSPDGRFSVLGFRVLRSSIKSSVPIAIPEVMLPETPPVIIVRAGTRAGKEQSANSLKMVWCPPGKFTMGSPAGESGRKSNEGQVSVTLTQGFWLGKYEVTQREWRDVMGSEPWKGKFGVKEGDQIAATWVSWDDAVAFCEKLTASERKSGRLPDGWEYTLPTEAQWEYACRAGTRTLFSFGDRASRLGEYAWFKENTNVGNQRYARPVGQKHSNAWNLHDMHGNVSEWCRDWYDRAKRPGGTDPRGPSAGSDRVYRGGSWGNIAWACRSAYRSWQPPGYRFNNRGFRVLSSSIK